MGSFLYFWPEKKDDRVRANDLLDSFNGALAYMMPEETRDPENLTTTKGPGNKPGLFFAYAGPGKKSPHLSHLVKAAKQWHPLHGTDVQFAWDPENPPEPEDLVRPEIVPGYKVKLADGNTWEIPLVRAMDGSTNFKRPLIWDGSQWSPGKVHETDMPMYQAIEEIWKVSEAEGEGRKIMATIPADTLLAAQGIIRNHRVSPCELSERRILDTDNYTRVIAAMMGLRLVDALKKNRESSGPGTTDGGED